MMEVNHLMSCLQLLQSSCTLTRFTHATLFYEVTSDFSISLHSKHRSDGIVCVFHDPFRVLTTEHVKQTKNECAND